MMPYGRSRLLDVKRRVFPTRRLMAEHPRQRSQSVCGIPSLAGLRGSAGVPPARAGVGSPPHSVGPQPQAVAGRGQAGTVRLHRGGRPVRPCRSLSRAAGRAKGSGQTRAF
jgi:hypothetical protein